jgi:serine/threonine-protein kinase
MRSKNSPILGMSLNRRYLVEKEIGRGGFGAVYLARDKQLHLKPVVIKILLKHPDDDPWLKRKFRQEIEALTRIDHPGVIGALDSGEMPDGALFLVMQFVEGVSLRSAINADGMSFGRAASILRQIGQALSAAHDKGIYHRDLKPENIMLQTISADEEYVKLIDFGIALVRDSQITSGNETSHVAGTIAYMAPEQLMGKPSAASDIYALGVIAYEMVTGRRPFTFDTPYQLYELQRDGVRVKPIDLRPSLPEDVQRAILKAISFEPKDRHSRARDLGEELAQALTSASQRWKRASDATTASLAVPIESPKGYGVASKGKRTGTAPAEPRIPLSPPQGQSALAHTKEPNLGHFVFKTCNRRRQVNEFTSFFVSNLKQRPGVPQIFIVHGEERECHDSLVERLIHTEIKRFAERKWGEYKGVVTYKKLGWAYEGELSLLEQELLRMLFAEFDPAYMEDDLSSIALANLISAFLSPLVVIQHRIHASRWDKFTIKLIESYMRFWEGAGNAPSKPQFLIFLNIIYPKPQSGSWWKSLLSSKRFDKDRIESELQDVSASQSAGCPCLMLRELEPLRQDEVKDWFSFNNLYSEKVREELLQKIFTTEDGGIAECKNMADVEHELQAIIESIQQKSTKTRDYL